MAQPTARSGLRFALGAYLVWGAFPLYFKALKSVSPLEILAHRILWSAVFLAGLATISRRWPEYLEALRSRRRLAIYGLSTALITGNWLLYIWAVNAGHVLEASLGYFVNPIVNVLLGVLFLRERLRPGQAAALALAALGASAFVVRLGTFPWLALALAFTFGGYGLVRKKADIDPLVGLLVETSLLAAPAAALIVGRALAGGGGLRGDGRTAALLLLAGVITSVPLIWFARGVRSLRLSTMGVLQYVTPSLQFLAAVLLYREPFTSAHALAFGLIWASLALYTGEALLQPPAERSGAAPQ